MKTVMEGDVNIAIAKFYGYTFGKRNIGHKLESVDCCIYGDQVTELYKLPWFTRSLDLMHKVELKIWQDEALVELYEQNLKKVYLKAVGYDGYAYWFMASAFNRAEAILMTIESDLYKSS